MQLPTGNCGSVVIGCSPATGPENTSTDTMCDGVTQSKGLNSEAANDRVHAQLQYKQLYGVCTLRAQPQVHAHHNTTNERGKTLYCARSQINCTTSDSKPGDGS